MSFFEELKRRNVFRVGLAYAVVAWLLLQVADVMIDNIGAPDWVFRTLLLALAVGLPVALIFAWAFELTPEGIKKEKDVDRTQSITAHTGRKLDRVIISIMAVVIAFLVLDRFVLVETDPAPTEGMAREPGSELATADPATRESIAVLPFVNMSGDPENEYFSDGLTETLLHMLAQIPELRVAARTSSFAFKDKGIGIAEIAQTLGVAHVLEGSVQKSGERVRVTAQLIRAGDGFHVWSQSYTRPLQDIFAIQDEIAADVARSLDITLLGGVSAPAHPATESIDAYDLYLRALEQAAIGSYGSLAVAEGLYKQALASDPDFDDAKLGLAVTYLKMANTGLLEPADMEARVRPLLSQVREDHPDNRLARVIELSIEYTEYSTRIKTQEQTEQAVQEMRRLLPLIPGQSYLRGQIAMAVAYGQGKLDEGLEIIEAGLLVDPLSAELYAQQGNILRGQERYEEARQSYLKALELEPDDPNHYGRMARVSANMNDLRGSLEWRLRNIQKDPQDHELAANLAQVLYEIGLVEEGDNWTSRVRALAPTSDLLLRLSIDRALAEDKPATIIELAEEMIRQPVTMRHGAFPTALFSWRGVMSSAGRNREAYEFLLNLRPGLEDFSRTPDDLYGVVMQQALLELTYLIKPPGERLLAWERYTEQRNAMGDVWYLQDPYTKMLDHLFRNDVDGAVAMALEDLAQPLAAWPTRPKTYDDPLLAEVTANPAVAARLSELQRELDQARSEVRELLQQPEWTL